MGHELQPDCKVPAVIFIADKNVYVFDTTNITNPPSQNIRIKIKTSENVINRHTESTIEAVTTDHNVEDLYLIIQYLVGAPPASITA